MTEDDCNRKNRGSFWLLMGLILLVAVAIVVYGIVVSANEEAQKKIDAYIKRADTFMDPDEVSSILQKMDRTKQIISECEREVAELQETVEYQQLQIESYQLLIDDINSDMVELNKTITDC